MARRFPVSILSVAAAAALTAVVFVATRVADARARADSILALAPPVSDAGTLQLISSLDSRSRVLGAIAVDLDRDGDLDVVATTADEAVVIWLNEGPGRLVRGQARHTHVSNRPAFDDARGAGRTTATTPGSRATAIALTASAFDHVVRAATHVETLSSRPLGRGWDAGGGRAPPTLAVRS